VALVLESRTSIAAPPLPVWALLVDTKSWKSWWPAVREARTFDHKPLHDRSRFEMTLELGRLTLTVRPTVTLAAEGKTVEWEGHWAAVPMRQEWFIDGKPEGSRVTARITFFGFGGTLLDWLRIGRVWDRMLQEQLRSLKRTAERL